MNILEQEKVIQHRIRDIECHQAAISVGKPNKRFSDNVDDGLVRVSPIDNSAQKNVAASLHAHILRLCHYSLFVGHPGKRQLYDTMLRDLYCPHIANNKLV